MNELYTKEEIPDTEMVDAKMPSQVSPRVPLKKRNRQKHLMKHNMLKRQGSSSLEPKHPRYKKYGHIKRVNFVIFLKILMHLLEQDKEMHLKAQEMIRESIKSQREGKLQDTPLMSALKGRLFGLVGKDLWDECERYLQAYLDYHNIQTDL